VLRRSGFKGAVHLVETSPALRAAQKRLLPDANFHDRIDDLPDAPLLLIANEFLDALPIRQTVDRAERRVGIKDDALAFDQDGQVVEQSPAREAAVAALSVKLARSGGVAILIDYGHGHSAAGDTLQAVRGHAFAPVLADPGEQDLTAHVDFKAVAEAARGAGAVAGPVVTQGEWLERLGIAQRARQLTEANPARGEEIASALERLTASDAMGSLFKVIALRGPGGPEPAGFA
jgi:NADH dehydrogenase [ubiquinone] 1 alpha subcomplex assembly factor 7